MYNNYDDFYALGHNEGCCLKCSNSYEGCLCFECKCTKCCWYISPYDNEDDEFFKGKCGKIKDLQKGTPFPYDLTHKRIKVKTIKPHEFFKDEK